MLCGLTAPCSERLDKVLASLLKVCRMQQKSHLLSTVNYSMCTCFVCTYLLIS